MYDSNNIFSGAIDVDGTIYMVSMGRNRQKVGIDEQREKELLDQIAEQNEIIENYYNKLVEIGVIIPSKTPEQIALEQAEQQKEINTALLEAIASLKDEVASMRGSTVAKSATVDAEPAKPVRKSTKKTVEDVDDD